MKLQYSNSDIFESDCEAWVNPVNCEGVMGKGLALGFKTRFPHMFAAYKRECELDKIKIGICHVYTEPSPAKPPHFVVNFPTKCSWREPSKLEWIRDGLEDLEAAVQYYEMKSLALPILGAGLGKLNRNEVIPLIEQFAQNVSARVVLYQPIMQERSYV